ncbi:nucleotide-diphospho-sugar transferase [Ilyonectria destructans]|nr:nucleotide-diphospho-sugar transferase [Ilyonectria destructans]
MTTVWQYPRQWTTGTGTGTADCEAPYDEDLVGCERASGWWCLASQRQFLRLRRVAVYLLLVDLMLVWLLLRSLDPLITLLRRNEELFSARVALSRTDTPGGGRHSDRHNIPLILHQTCANETIPHKWVDSRQSCKEVYSDFEYKLWTDASARDFISSEYPWFLDTWDNYPFPIQRADSIRYFILHYYGGIYLDMDILCNKTFPLDQVESGTAIHNAIFKSTLPTGVSNDFMISSAGHPAFTAAIHKLPLFYGKNRLWARLLPYAAIMISSGPFFITLMVKDYLLKQPLIHSPTVQVINGTELAPYITDLESCTWHRDDAKAIMWLRDRL